MDTYLRFTPEEYRGIARACRSAQFTDDSFPGFRRLLVESLARTLPDLAGRIARFPAYQLGILYEFLKEQRAVRAGGNGPPACPPCDLTAEELQAVAQVGEAFALPDRFRAAFKNFLVRKLWKSWPGLAGKLDRLSDGQLERLCRQIKARKKETG
jgi:hypothetical protein